MKGGVGVGGGGGVGETRRKKKGEEIRMHDRSRDDKVE